MEFFLCEVFGVPHWHHIEHLDRVLQNNALHYHEIYRHSRVRFNLVFARIFHACMGCEPSLLDVHTAYDIHVKRSAYKPAHESCLEFLMQHTFFRVYHSLLTQLYGAFKKDIIEYENCIVTNDDIDFIKTELSAYVHKRLDVLFALHPEEQSKTYCLENKSLFQQFLSRFQKTPCTSLYAQEKTCILATPRDAFHENPLTSYILYPLPLPDWRKRLENGDWLNVTRADAMRFQMTRDTHFVRENVFRPCVFMECPREQADTMAQDLSQVIKKLMCVFHDTFPLLLFGSCVPRIFGLCIHVKHGSRSIAEHSPILVDKTLNLKNVLITTPDIIDAFNINTASRTCLYMIRDQNDILYMMQNKHVFFSRDTMILPTHAVCPFDREMWKAYLQLYVRPILCNSGKERYLSYRVAVVYAYILKVLWKRDIRLRDVLHRFKTRNNVSNKNKCILFIHNQPCFWGIYNALVTWFHMDEPETWDIVFYGSQKSHAYAQSIVGDGARYLTHKSLEQETFDREDYNILLKDQTFWTPLADMKYQKGLIVQDDSVILRQGLGEYVHNYDYIGAAWTHCPGNDQLITYIGDNLVGNGGLSVRDIETMIKITQTFTEEKRLLFNNMIQQIPEDVYFSMCCQKLGKRVVTESLADRIFIEENFCLDALGFHKFWVYHDMYRVDEFFTRLMKTAHPSS